MRQLEEKITAWRAALTGKTAPEVIEELETHLRESIEGHVANGKSLEEAFALAAQRLGANDALAREFAKAGERGWLPVRLAFGVAMATAVVLTAFMPKIFPKAFGVLLAAHVWTITLGYLSLFLIGALGICYALQRLFREPAPSSERSAARGARSLAKIALATSAVGVVLGSVWTKKAWGFAWSWDIKEIGGLCVVIWLAFFLAAQPRMSARGGMLLALIGNWVVSFAWFGAMPSLTPMTILLALNTVALLIALLPTELLAKATPDHRESARR